jgi:CRP-like cAMP-binding protein
VRDDTALRASLFSSRLLRVLDASSRADVWLAGTVRTAAAGEVLFGRGAPATSLFVVARGSVAVDGGIDPSTGREGDVFGWDSVAPGRARSGRAIAREPCTVLEVPLGVLRDAGLVGPKGSRKTGGSFPQPAQLPR